MFRTGLVSFIKILAVVASAGAAVAQTNPLVQQEAGNRSTPISATAAQIGKLPLSFEPNLGQTANQVQWLARGPRYTLYLAGHDAVIQLTDVTPAKPGVAAKVDSSAVRMNLLGAQKVERAGGEDLQSGKSNYFTGKDPARWQRNVPTYGKVRLRGVYPGIDLVYYGRQGQLEYDFVVAPGADPSAIRWGLDGAKASMAANGDVQLAVDETEKEIRLNKPVIYQMKNGARQPIEGSFAIAKNGEASFKLGAYDTKRELVIDPTLVFLGVIGAGGEPTQVNGIAVDTNLNEATGKPYNELILTGVTAEANFPATKGAYQTSCTTPNGNGKAARCTYPTDSSAYIMRLSADGSSLVYATYLHGGDGYESGEFAAVDSLDDDVVILGQTSSNDFPTTGNAYQTVCLPVYNGGQPNIIVPNCDGNFAGGGTEWVIQGPSLFLAKLDGTGSSLEYSSFFSGTDFVYAEGLALDSSDNMYFTGYEQQANAVANTYPNNGNTFVQFPITSGAFQAGLENQPAATISVLSADGQTLIYSSFIGDPTNGVANVPEALAVSPTGLVALGGVTQSSSMPTTSGSLRPSCVQNSPPNGNCKNQTGWLSVFDPTQQGSSSLVYSSYIGGPEFPNGNNANNVLGLAFDAKGYLYLTGNTITINYPTTPGVVQPTCNHNNNSNTCNTGFLSKLDLNNGSKYVWSTYFGGTNSSATTGYSIAFDSRGWVYLYGYNNGYSNDLPLVNQIESCCDEWGVVFVAAFSSDARQLLFSTPLENLPTEQSGFFAVPNGLALDSDGNMYVAAYGNDSGSLQAVGGAYAEKATGGFNRTYFAKISKVLGPVATALTVSPLNALPGSSVTFTATITPTAQTTPTPTGTVTVINNNTSPATTLGKITLGSKGSGSFTADSLGRGEYGVIGNYSGDSNYETGSSKAQTLTINQFQPRLKVTPSALTLLRTQALTVTVAANGGTGNPVPTGMIVLSSGKYASAAVALKSGVATIDVPKNELNDGGDILTATYAPGAASLKTYRASTGSAVVTVSKASQSIHFIAPPGTVKYGVKPIKLTATATSGLPVTFTVVSGRGTIKGGVLTITGAGDLEVAASQTGNESYRAAAEVKHSIVVTKATLKVEANNLTMKQGAKVPTLTYSFSGFVNGDTAPRATSGKPTLTTTATSSSKPGPYPIKISAGKLTAKSYKLIFVNGTMTVTP